VARAHEGPLAAVNRILYRCNSRVTHSRSGGHAHLLRHRAKTGWKERMMNWIPFFSATCSSISEDIASFNTLSFAPWFHFAKSGSGLLGEERMFLLSQRPPRMDSTRTHHSPVMNDPMSWVVRLTFHQHCSRLRLNCSLL